MPGFDPYESLLRNFSKHKFRTHLEQTILNPEVYPQEHLAEHGDILKEKWDAQDIAEMKMPTMMGLMFGITSFNRWVFRLDHTEDGLIDEQLYDALNIKNLIRKQ